jgi:hypothetical protein
MAFLKDYEFKGSGIVVESAYHAITELQVQKRLVDVPPPPDNSRDDGLTFGFQRENNEIEWKAGNIATLGVSVWKNADYRNSNSQSIGYVGSAPSNKFIAGGPNEIFRCFIEPTSSLNYTQQAYNYLATHEYFSGSQPA